MFLSSVPTLGPGKIKNRDNAGIDCWQETCTPSLLETVD